MTWERRGCHVVPDEWLLRDAGTRAEIHDDWKELVPLCFGLSKLPREDFCEAGVLDEVVMTTTGAVSSDDVLMMSGDSEKGGRGRLGVYWGRLGGGVPGTDT